MKMRVVHLIFYVNDPATTEIYTLSLHDALPIYLAWRVGRLGEERRHLVAVAGEHRGGRGNVVEADERVGVDEAGLGEGDRKSTRLNSSHANLSYAVFCLNKQS